MHEEREPSLCLPRVFTEHEPNFLKYPEPNPYHQRTCNKHEPKIWVLPISNVNVHYLASPGLSVNFPCNLNPLLTMSAAPLHFIVLKVRSNLGGSHISGSHGLSGPPEKCHTAVVCGTSLIDLTKLECVQNAAARRVTIASKCVADNDAVCVWIRKTRRLIKLPISWENGKRRCPRGSDGWYSWCRLWFELSAAWMGITTSCIPAVSSVSRRRASSVDSCAVWVSLVIVSWDYDFFHLFTGNCTHWSSMSVRRILY